METQSSIKKNIGIGIFGSLADTQRNKRLLPAKEAAANIINIGDNSEQMQKWREKQAGKAKQEYDEATRQFDISSQVLKKSFPGLVELLENNPADQHDEILNRWKEENPDSVIYLDKAIDTLQKSITVLNDSLLSYSNKLLAFEAGKIKANGASAGPAGSAGDNAKNGAASDSASDSARSYANFYDASKEIEKIPQKLKEKTDTKNNWLGGLLDVDFSEMARKAAETILGTIKNIMLKFSGGGQQATNEEGRQGAAVDGSVGGEAAIEDEGGAGMR